MYADDIAGLTPQQIQNKFALPYTPTHMVDVAIPQGTQIRYGYANSLYGNEGGGLQFDFMGHENGLFSDTYIPLP
jgi:hypothetical protein